MLTKDAFIWSKNTNIVKYYYNLKELFSNWIYFKMQFIPVTKQESFSGVTWSFKNHLGLKKYLLLLITVVLLIYKYLDPPRI